MISIKYNEFIRVAKYLNTEVGITPLLFGSLGLEQRLNMDLSADDIDVLIPQIFIEKKWVILKKRIEDLGYSLTDLDEHEFRNNKFKLTFA